MLMNLWWGNIARGTISDVSPATYELRMNAPGYPMVSGGGNNSFYGNRPTFLHCCVNKESETKRSSRYLPFCNLCYQYYVEHNI